MLPDLSCFARPSRRGPFTTLIVLCSLGAGISPSMAGDLERDWHDTVPGATVRPTPIVHATSAAAIVPFGRFTSIQVNVDPTGANILGDAANEPSIAVDPTNPSRMAIGWRQFDTVQSTFREGGVGYTTDGGLTWHAGKVDPGVFLSDPVLSSDADGNFFFMGITILNFTLASQLFASTDHGATWGPPVFAFGGDKEWMTIDRTHGPGRGYIYETWESDPPTFSRSIDGGQSFQSPTVVPSSPSLGTMDVGPDGTVYLTGTNFHLDTFYVARSTNAKFAAQTPTFTTVPVNMGGSQAFGSPNGDGSLEGLLGQPWVTVDPSRGLGSNVYVLCSVKTATDPMDVMFARSTDGGQTWSSPVRVNDDPGNHAYQWFGTMSVAPNGRIDAVWNDTRNSGDRTRSALFYSYSNDAGMTWSPNEQASPEWDSDLGWSPPGKTKIGDYYHMVSSNSGADLAWSATFNGEQDVYYLRIPAPSGMAVQQGPSRSVEAGADQLRLLQSSPNPFTSSITIDFAMPGSGGRAKVEVFDASGRRITTLLNGLVKAGLQSVRWNGVDDAGRAVKSGLYVCRLDAAGASKTLKLMLMR